MKKRISLVILVCLLVMMVGQVASAGWLRDLFSGEKEKNDKIVIGVAAPDFDDKWLTYLYDGMKEYQKEYEDVKVIYTDARRDSAKQLSQVENFVAQRVDAIIVIPVDPVSVGSMLKITKEADIPLIGVNRMFDGMEQATAFVGSKEINAGRMQLEYIANKLNGEGNIAIINGQMGHTAQINRTAGNKEIINEYPDMKVVLEGTGKWQRAKAMSLMENWLQTGVKIDAVVCNNDEMAIGAMKAIKAAGKLDEIIVAGIDATPDALKYLKNGEISVSVFQSAYGQGAKGLETAIKVVKGENVAKKVWVPFELVTSENHKIYVKKWE